MPAENILKATEDSSSYTAVNTVELLLQQHRSLLLRSTVSQVTYRVINMVLLLLALTSHYVLYLPIALISIAALVSGIWTSERRFLSARISAVEKALGKRSPLQSEDAYVAYRFAASSMTEAFRLLRFEPALWLVAVSAISALRLIVRG